MSKSRRNRYFADKGSVTADQGSVTAELALALPSVALVIAVTLGAFTLQIERMKLVDLAATGSRALARGEQPTQVELMVKAARPDLVSIIEHEENQVCLSVSFMARIPGLGSELLEVSERQCARKMGL
jgi:hypothetical protein